MNEQPKHRLVHNTPGIPGASRREKLEKGRKKNKGNRLLLRVTTGQNKIPPTVDELFVSFEAAGPKVHVLAA